ncbi:MAG: hypothetical protein JWL59_3868 [Chthoniobacteraceae bacterium]|nr:hypothetical protein [Chthoniobacteraceae bacterium]
MSTTIQCLVNPPSPNSDRLVTGGKNLADAFVGAAIGGIDIMALMEDPNMELPEGLDESLSSRNPFNPLSPFIDKQSAFMGQVPSQFFSPADGLAAIEQVIAALRGLDGEHAVPNPDLREGAIYDLEQYAGLLRSAQQQGATFTFYMEQ